MRIAVIRLKGSFSLSPTVKSTLSNLKLGKLYNCTLISPTASNRGMLQACKDFVAFGEVDEETVALLLSKRGRIEGNNRLSASKKQEEIAKLAKEISSSEKPISTFGIQPVFSLSPPKGGFGIRKAHVPFGPIGKNPEIAALRFCGMERKVCKAR